MEEKKTQNKNENKKERGAIKIDFTTALGIGSIIVLSIAVLGLVFFINGMA